MHILKQELCGMYFKTLFAKDTTNRKTCSYKFGFRDDV